jgi:hypothetical protein
MKSSDLIESVFDQVLADKEKNILQINVEDIINNNEPKDEIELIDVEVEENTCLTCNSIDENEEVTNNETVKPSCTEPQFDPIQNIDRLIEEHKEFSHHFSCLQSF